MTGAPGARTAAAATGRGEAQVGLRERKKARLRQQIIDVSIRLFRKQGYEATRIDDIVQSLEISQPTFFRYFPTKDAVLREVGEGGYACICERLRCELSSKAGTGERLRRLYITWRARWKPTGNSGKRWCCRAPWIQYDRPNCAGTRKLPSACCRKF